MSNTLYHYCGVSAFQGIIESKEFWLSNCSTMNDFMEHRWLISKASDRLKHLNKSRYGAYIKDVVSKLESVDSPYLFCFSSQPDLLSQWRAYCDNGAGFAIGFSKDIITSMLPQWEDVSLEEVIYKDEILNNFISSLFTDEFIKQCKERTVPNPAKTFSRLGWAITKRAIVFKNQGFEEESEWRLVYNIPYIHKVFPWNVAKEDFISEMHFRKSGDKIVPYFKLIIPNDAITEIILGPKNFARNNNTCVKFLLKANGFDVDKIKIVNSKVSYQ